MNYNHTPKSNHGRRAILLLILTAGIVLAIVYLKQTTSREKQLHLAVPADSLARPVAVPDTTVAPGLLPAQTDTVSPSVLADTVLGKDKRDPYEAGYEDGYGAGSDDGAARDPKASYDETNNFHSTREKQKYAQGYAEGYEKGYDDGEQKRQFNIRELPGQP